MKSKQKALVYIQFADCIRQFYAAYNEQIRNLGVTDNQSKILHFLYDHEGMSQQEMANLFNVKRSSMSEALSEMENLGLVERRSAENDKRFNHIFLTEAGREKGSELVHLYENYIVDLLAVLSKDEQTQLRHMLTKICNESISRQNSEN